MADSRMIADLTNDVYEELDTPTVINAPGTKPQIGGSRIQPEAVEAMATASESFV